MSAHYFRVSENLGSYGVSENTSVEMGVLVRSEIQRKLRTTSLGFSSAPKILWGPDASGMGNGLEQPSPSPWC